LRNIRLSIALKSATCVLALAAGGLVSPAHAQDGSEGEEEIVVTGSRIARTEYSQPNPINVLDAEALEQSGQTNITEFVADQPALIGSQTSTLSAGSNLLNAQQTGANFLNLRNLGTSRTLTLVNGRRHVAGYPGSAAVDTNTIPTDLVERIESGAEWSADNPQTWYSPGPEGYTDYPALVTA